MNPSPVCVSENANYKTVKGLMKKYQISSFLVVGAENVESSPRLGGSLKKIIREFLLREISTTLNLKMRKLLPL